MRLAYLTSQYPATSHTFIKREVAAVRALGQRVDTFSIRGPTEAELRAEDDRREAQSTYTLLARPLRDFVTAHFHEFLRRPLKYVRTLLLALRHRPPGLWAMLLSIAHFGESILLAAELRRRKIEHLHNHFANSGATVGLLAAHQAEIRWSFTIHGISEFDYPAGLLLPQKVVAAEFVACVSYFGRAQAARLVDPDQWSKLHIVRCGLALDQLPPARFRSGAEARLIFVGRLSPEKGIAGLIEALSLMKAHPRPRLTIVGDGPLRGSLEVQAQALGISNSIDFVGRLPEAETLSQIAASDVLVLPSFMEGLPIVLMEALAVGVPVVASRVAGIPELVEEGATGLLFAPSNWMELAHGLDRLAGDPALRLRMGEQGPVCVKQSFDVAKSAAKLRDLFASVARPAATQTERPSSTDPSTLGPSTGHIEAI